MKSPAKKEKKMMTPMKMRREDDEDKVEEIKIDWNNLTERKRRAHHPYLQGQRTGYFQRMGKNCIT